MRRLVRPCRELASTRAPSPSPGCGMGSSCRAAACSSCCWATLPISPCCSIRRWANRRLSSHWSRRRRGSCSSQSRSSGLRARGATCSCPVLARRSIACSCRASRCSSSRLMRGSTTCTWVRGPSWERRCSRASESTTVAAFGARTVKGAGTPGRRLGSTSHGQLDSSATSRQPTNTLVVSRRRQGARACRGRSWRHSRHTSCRRRRRRAPQGDGPGARRINATVHVCAQASPARHAEGQ